MKKLYVLLLALTMVMSLTVTGCSSSKDDEGKVENAAAGNVVELEGQQDQYGWFPHMRLTFDGDVLTEVYFDYIDDAGAKKSQDEEYNAGMKEKTGTNVKEALEALRANLIAVQNPDQVDVVTGATQTSTEFMTMAKQAYDQYFNGETSANNYGNGDPTTTKDDATTQEQNGVVTESQTPETAPTYDNGGDGSPNNAENSQNAPGATNEGSTGAAAPAK